MKWKHFKTIPLSDEKRITSASVVWAYLNFNCSSRKLLNRYEQNTINSKMSHNFKSEIYISIRRRQSQRPKPDVGGEIVRLRIPRALKKIPHCLHYVPRIPGIGCVRNYYFPISLLFICPWYRWNGLLDLAICRVISVMLEQGISVERYPQYFLNAENYIELVLHQLFNKIKLLFNLPFQ